MPHRSPVSQTYSWGKGCSFSPCHICSHVMWSILFTFHISGNTQILDVMRVILPNPFPKLTSQPSVSSPHGTLNNQQSAVMWLNSCVLVNIMCWCHYLHHQAPVISTRFMGIYKENLLVSLEMSAIHLIPT